MLPHYHSECSLCSTAWSEWFGKPGTPSRLLLERFGSYLKDCCKVTFGYVITWKTAERFGYFKDCCKVIRERLLQAGLDTWKTTARLYAKDYCKRVWIPERLLQGLDTWKTAALGIEAWSTMQCGATSDVHISSMLLLNNLGYAYSSVSNVAPRTLGVLQASTPKAEVLQVSNGSSLSRSRFLRQITNVIMRI